MTDADHRRGRIAILLPDLRLGGAEMVNLALAGEFRRRGYLVDLVLMRGKGELLADVPPGAEIVDLGAPRFRNLLGPLVRYLRRRRPDMLLAAMWPLSGMAVAARHLSGSRSRCVISEHSNLSRSAAVRGLSDIVNRRLGAFIYGAADAVVAVSRGVKDDLVARTGVSADQVRVIHNPIRKPDMTAQADPALLSWWKGSEKAIIAVGSLKPAKDYPTLLRAFAQLVRRRDARLVIFGEGPSRAELESLTAKLGLQERVRLPGVASNPFPYLAKADLFVLSSAWEGFGNVIVEALAVGASVVSTDCRSGPAEILDNGRYGRLTQVGDPVAMADAMDTALNAPLDPEVLKARSAEFSVERAADEYLALLDPRAGLTR